MDPEIGRLFLKPELYIVAAVLAGFFGPVLKSSKVSNNNIPVILGLIGILLCLKIEGFCIDAVLQGIFATIVAMGSHQAVKRTLFRGGKTDDNTKENPKP